MPSRSPRTELYRLLWASQAPAYAVDSRRRIVFCNEACAAWTGVSVEDLLGAECQYLSAAASDPVATAARGLCPPPGAEQEFETTSVVWAPRQGSSPVFRRATFFAIQHAPGEFAGLLALVGGEDTTPPDSEQQNAATDLSRPEQLHAAVAAFRQRQRARFSLERFIGQSPAIKQARRQMQLAALGAARTVIVGPPGSGREQAARAIHLGPADQTVGPLAPLRCELLDAELLQSTITAFLRRGRQIETERPAALLLLEADQLSSEAQTELAGFLTILEIDLQALSTARVSLLELAQNGHFKHDLACALTTQEIVLPPLRDRLEDLELLAQSMLEDNNQAGDKQLAGLTPEAIELLLAYDWPGNFDELSHAIEQAHAAAAGPLVRADDLPDYLRHALAAERRPERGDEPIELDQLLADIEQRLIREALRRTNGNKSQAARLLGLSRARLHRKLEEAPDEPGD